MSQGKKTKAVREALNKIFKTKNQVPELDDLIDSLLKEFGGVKQFAKIYATTAKTTESPMLKAKLLDGAMRLITSGASKRSSAGLEQITDEELTGIAEGFVDHVSTQEKTGAEADRPAADPGSDAGSPAATPGPDAGAGTPGRGSDLNSGGEGSGASASGGDPK